MLFQIPPQGFVGIDKLPDPCHIVIPICLGLLLRFRNHALAFLSCLLLHLAADRFQRITLSSDILGVLKAGIQSRFENTA